MEHEVRISCWDIEVRMSYGIQWWDTHLQVKKIIQISYCIECGTNIGVGLTLTYSET